MMVAPDQVRLNNDGEVTLVVLHDSGKLKTLCVFPSIFKGEHVKHTEIFSVLKGREISVKFDRPVALQIDGETVLDVSEYRVSVGVAAKELANA
jgi:diacylglycerol kinase family enzyme